jgi:riboflavin kinase/FMN adenylyltransferase
MRADTITGIVMEGKRRGSALGYPTANIAFSSVDADGVYAAVVTADGNERHAAVFVDSKRGLLEAHLLDFFGDLYGTEITVELKKKIRDTETFANDEALKAAIAEDVLSVRQSFAP